MLFRSAGVLAMRPRCIVLDEPTAMLDPDGRREVLQAVLDLNREEKITIILITHFMEEVIHSDRIFVMNKGKLMLQGTPEYIFSKVEELQEYHLEVPQATYISHLLKKSGFQFESTILTTEQLVRSLCQKEVSVCK